MRVIKLRGEKVSLAPVERDDIALWYRWLNDLDVTLPLGNEAYSNITLDSQADSYDSMAKNGEATFTIVENAAGRAVGRCLLFNTDRVNRNAMAGIYIGEKDCWSKGYGGEALELLLDYGFNILNLNSVMLGAYSYNKRAVACYKRIGFKEIGLRREARIVGEKKYDIVMMDMLASEFQSSRLKAALPD
jgi:RimJ/RimL family protein N-acetyltransferase